MWYSVLSHFFLTVPVFLSLLMVLPPDSLKLIAEVILIKDSESRKAEVVVQRCSVKKVFLKTLQNSQENTSARVSFLIKLQALGLQPYQERDSGTGVFL